MQNNILLFFDIGGGELFFIVLVIIMFFGSKRIPELARGIGKGIREIKNATNDIQQEIKDSTKEITNLTGKADIGKQVKDFIDKTIIVEGTKPIQDEEVAPSLPNTVPQSRPTNSSTENPS